MYDSIPLGFAIPAFILMIALLVWLKWRDYKRIQQLEAANEISESEIAYLYNVQKEEEIFDAMELRTDTPVYERLANQHLSFETRNRIEKDSL